MLFFSFFFSYFSENILLIIYLFLFPEGGVSKEQYSQTAVASRAGGLRGYDGLTGQASFTALPPYHPNSGGDDGDNDGRDYGDETRSRRITAASDRVRAKFEQISRKVR